MTSPEEWERIKKEAVRQALIEELDAMDADGYGEEDGEGEEK